MKDNQNITKMIEYPKSGILSKEIFKDDKQETDLFCMAAGTKMGEHTSSKNGLIHVIEGDGEFILEGKKIKMIPGVLIKMGKHAVHSLSANKNTAFVLILTK